MLTTWHSILNENDGWHSTIHPRQHIYINILLHINIPLNIECKIISLTKIAHLKDSERSNLKRKKKRGINLWNDNII